MPLTCVIIDDEPKAIEILTRYVERINFLELSGTYRDATDAYASLSTSPVDIVFLDISLPGLSGVELAKLLPPATKIVFTTAYHKFAVEGFNLSAVDYLVKPITFERFLKAISKLKELQVFREKLELAPMIATEKNQPGTIFFKSGTTIYKTNVDDILYLEKEGNYFKLCSKERSFLIRLNFNELMNMLPADHFIRIHKSYIINTDHINKVESNFVYIGNTALPLGLNFKTHFLDYIRKQ